MRNSTPNADFPEDLALLALLYSSGELEGAEAVAFEARLAVDQEARDAVAQAVQLSLTAAGERCAPDAAWREETKSRLLQRASLWQRLAGPRVYRGHPAVWASGRGSRVLFLSLMPAPPAPNSTASVEPPPQSRGRLRQKPPSLPRSPATIPRQGPRRAGEAEAHR